MIHGIIFIKILTQEGFMSNSEQAKNIMKWIKLFTYISATILLIANNNLGKINICDMGHIAL